MYILLPSILLVYQTFSTLLDAGDPSLYFSTSHYDLKETKNEISLSNNFDINIDLETLTIDFIEDNNKLISLDIFNDNDFNDISLISSVTDNNNKNSVSTIEYKQYIAIDKSLDYNSAQLYCNNNYYGNLASIISLSDNIVINKLCAMLPNNDNDCWIGLKEPFFKWENNQIIQYKNIANDDNNNDIYAEDIDNEDAECMVIVNDDNTWNKVSCDSTHAFICERSMLSYRGGYVNVGIKLDYHNAQSYCRNKFGTTLADNYDGDIVEIGDNVWINNDGDDVCVQLDKYKQKREIDCNMKRFFVCNRYINTYVDGKDGDDGDDDKSGDIRRRLAFYSGYNGMYNDYNSYYGNYYYDNMNDIMNNPHLFHHHHHHHGSGGEYPSHGMHIPNFVHGMHGGMGGMGSMGGMGGMGGMTGHGHHHHHGNMGNMGGMGGGGGNSMNPMLMGMMMSHMGNQMQPRHVYDVHQDDGDRRKETMRDMMRMMKKMGRERDGNRRNNNNNNNNMGGMGGMMNPMMTMMMMPMMMRMMNPMMGMMNPMMMNPMMGGMGMMNPMMRGMGMGGMNPMMMNNMNRMNGMNGMNGMNNNNNNNHHHHHHYDSSSRSRSRRSSSSDRFHKHKKKRKKKSSAEVYSHEPHPSASDEQHKPIVVIHSKTSNEPRIKTEYVDSQEANKIQSNGGKPPLYGGRKVRHMNLGKGRRRRRLLDYENDNEYKYNSMDINMNGISKCISVKDYEICLKYDINDMLYSLDVNYMYKKPVKYESMDDNNVKYFNEIHFVSDNKQKCSKTLTNIGYKLCINTENDDIKLYFEKDDTYNNYVEDNQFENIQFRFNDTLHWNEVYYDNSNNDLIQKCAYLSTTKICIMKTDKSIEGVIKFKLGI